MTGMCSSSWVVINPYAVFQMEQIRARLVTPTQWRRQSYSTSLVSFLVEEFQLHSLCNCSCAWACSGKMTAKARVGVRAIKMPLSLGELERSYAETLPQNLCSVKPHLSGWVCFTLKAERQRWRMSSLTTRSTWLKCHLPSRSPAPARGQSVQQPICYFTGWEGDCGLVRDPEQPEGWSIRDYSPFLVHCIILGGLKAFRTTQLPWGKQAGLSWQSLASMSMSESLL